MIGGKVSVTSQGPGIEAIKKSIATLSHMQAYVGIPAENAETVSNGLNNAQKLFLNTQGSMRKEMKGTMDAGATYQAAYDLYIHSFGSPLWSIPPRPVLEPAIEEPSNKAAIVGYLKMAMQEALDGKTEKAIQLLDRAGLEAEMVAKDWFTDARNAWAPNSPVTIAKKGSDKPLIDTGEMREAIAHITVEE